MSPPSGGGSAGSNPAGGTHEAPCLPAANPQVEGSFRVPLRAPSGVTSVLLKEKHDMCGDVTVSGPSSNTQCRRTDRSMRAPSGAAGTKSGAAAIPAAHLPAERDQITGHGCSCVSAIPLEHQAFGNLHADRNAVTFQTRRSCRRALSSDIHPALTSTPVLDSTMGQDAGDVTAGLMLAFRDMTSHGTTSTPQSWAYVRSASWFERRQPGVVFAREMASPLETRRRNLGLGCQDGDSTGGHRRQSCRSPGQHRHPAQRITPRPRVCRSRPGHKASEVSVRDCPIRT